MEQTQNRTIPVLLTVLTAALPVVLIASALRTYRQLEDQKSVYLRSRAAALAGRLETLPQSSPEGQWPVSQLIDTLSEDEPALVDLVIYERSSSPADLIDLWDGRELFRTGQAMAGGERVFRAFVPFHGPKGMRLARIDVAEDAADFLVDHARRHLMLVVLGAATILILTLLATRYARRAAFAERRQLELQHLAHIGEMSAVLAHEIRNPLGTIKGFAQLLAEKTAGEHEALLAPILSESSRLERLVKNLLLYGRPAQPAFKPTDSDAVAAIVRMHAGQLLDPSQPSLVTLVSPASFETDLNLLEQVLLNLLRNSADAIRGETPIRSAHPGVVRFELRPEGTEILMRISDNGPGFPPQALDRMYEPFFTRKASGTGLGLCISRKLAESLGGRLIAGNSAEGGAVVELRLPVHPESLSAPSLSTLSHRASPRRDRSWNRFSS